jgi:hypothetical protein
MSHARARRFLACLPVAALLALAAPAASGVEVMARPGIQSVPTVLPTPLSAIGSAWTAPSLAPSLSLAGPALAAPALTPQPLVQAAPVLAAAPVTVSPVVGTESGPLLAAPLGILHSLESFLHGAIVSPKGGAALDESKLKNIFDGDKRNAAVAVAQARQQAPALRPSQPGYEPHETVPQAVLPGGRSIPPDSFVGGYHGTDIAPDQVQENGGFPARGPVEDWRLQEHAEAASRPVSAFRGSTPYPTSPDGTTGASYWADEGNWVYQVSGVPTWGVNSELEGRVRRLDGIYRGNLMSEAEGAFPAQSPIECIQRWGQVSENSSGRLYVRPGDWVTNPRYDPAICRKFWGRPAS